MLKRAHYSVLPNIQVKMERNRVAKYDSSSITYFPNKRQGICGLFPQSPHATQPVAVAE